MTTAQCRMASSAFWPMTDLKLATPRLELRWPSLADLDALAELAAAGIHDPAIQPFMVPWTDASPEERARSVLQYQWRTWGSWQPSNWSLELAVVRDGELVGIQGVSGRDFAVRREVSTGSWLGLPHQGQGIGTQMRAAVLSLAFEGLGAEHATSGAYDFNASSLGVSRKLGYRDDGMDIHAVRDRPAMQRRLRLDRAGWLAAQSVPVEIAGLQRCLPHFGLGD
jgi:RimJ/RimL family protein N-acetyltransferase